MDKMLRKSSGGYKLSSRLMGRMPAHGEDARGRNMTRKKREGIKQVRRFLAEDLADQMVDLVTVDDSTIEDSLRQSMHLGRAWDEEDQMRSLHEWYDGCSICNGPCRADNLADAYGDPYWHDDYDNKYLEPEHDLFGLHKDELSRYLDEMED